MGRRGRISPTSIGIAAVLGFLGPLGGLAQAADPCAPPATFTGFAEVTVNLEAGTLNKVLPFDVPVRLCGSVPAGTKTVSVQYVEALNAPQVGADCSLPAGSPLVWQPATPIQARVADDNTFRLVLPRLKAQRFYALCFREQSEVSPEVAAQFQPLARQVLDQGLARIDSGNISSEQSAQLQKSLSDALRDLLNGREVIAPGTLFDSATPFDDLRGKFNAAVVKVLTPQLLRKAILQSYPQLQFALSESLRALQASAALGKLAAGLRAEAATNANLSELLAANAGGLALLDMGPDQLSRVALGQAPGDAGGPTLAEATDPAAVAAIAANYQTTDQQLAGLAALVGQMLDGTGPAAAAVRAPLGDADLADLRALTSPSGALQGARDALFSLLGAANRVRASLADRAAALDDLAARVALASVGVIVVSGSSTDNFDTFSSFYISADAGLVYSPEADKVVTYVGTNIYLRPVNKNAPLRQLGNFRQTFTRRFAFTLGLTVQTLADDAGTRQDLFGSQSLLAGAGLRITDMIRVGAGALVFEAKDRSPLVSEFHTAVSYYFTVSFDVNVARAFQG